MRGIMSLWWAQDWYKDVKSFKLTLQAQIFGSWSWTENPTRQSCPISSKGWGQFTLKSPICHDWQAEKGATTYHPNTCWNSWLKIKLLWGSVSTHITDETSSSLYIPSKSLNFWCRIIMPWPQPFETVEYSLMTWWGSAALEAWLWWSTALAMYNFQAERLKRPYCICYWFFAPWKEVERFLH